MSRENLFKVYFLTCFILQEFQSSGGIQSLGAEEDLYNVVFAFVEKTITKSEFIEHTELLFDLGEKALSEALEIYQDYRKSESI